METAETIALFDAVAYRLRRRTSGAQGGLYRGNLRGSGASFADHAPLLRHPDPRRVDIRRSISDPFGDTHVRRFELPTTVTAHTLVDLSASMAVSGATDRHALAALVTAAIAQGAVRSGDRFALTVAPGGDTPPEIRPASRHTGLAQEIHAAMTAMKPAGHGIEGLIAAATEIPARRTVTFVISDFEVAPDRLDALLGVLDGHAVRPIRLRDSGLDTVDGRFGLAEVRDPESGTARTVLMRPGLAERYRAARRRHEAEINRIFTRYGVRPLEIRDRLVVDEFVAGLAEEAV